MQKLPVIKYVVYNKQTPCIRTDYYVSWRKEAEFLSFVFEFNYKVLPPNLLLCVFLRMEPGFDYGLI